MSPRYSLKVRVLAWIAGIDPQTYTEIWRPRPVNTRPSRFTY